MIGLVRQIRTTVASSPSIKSTGVAGIAAEPAAAAEGIPVAELSDHEAATTCATSMLLQFRRDLVLSWRTKLGGNFKIRDDIPPPRNEAVPMTMPLRGDRRTSMTIQLS
uniref:Uncharacterized protein n=1 Tax=Manihot esculenta TaxID=3983 RepID=A0A2C9V243_MANES